MAKTLEDLPKFTVHSMEADGEHVLLEGLFDRIEGVRVDGWDYLYSFGPPYLAAEVASFDSQSKQAAYRVFREHASAKNGPGSVLYWLYAYWKHEVVDAVLDLQHVWAPLKFVAQDAYSRHWGSGRALSPVSQGPPAAAEYVRINDGWNHEHCGICNGHIDPGDEYYQRERVFICQTCFEKFVRTHDLSFLS